VNGWRGGHEIILKRVAMCCIKKMRNLNGVGQNVYEEKSVRRESIMEATCVAASKEKGRATQCSGERRGKRAKALKESPGKWVDKKKEREKTGGGGKERKKGGASRPREETTTSTARSWPKRGEGGGGPRKGK